MARYHDGAALVAQAAEELDGPQALTGIETLQGLVQHEELGIVHQGLGQLDPLAHAFGVGGERPLVGRVHLHRLDGARRGRGRVGQPVQDGGQGHELHDGLALEEPLLLRGDPDAPGDGGVGPGVLPEDAHRPL